jgi:hypothetical protein
MTLAWGVDKAFAALAEDVAAKQGQGLGQLSVLFLKLVVVRRGLIEHSLELIDTALSVVALLLGDLSLPLCDFGLLPQLIVAVEQVLEQPLALAWIFRESYGDTHNMRYTRALMLFQCEHDDFVDFFGPQPARWNRLRWRAVRRSIPESSMTSCAGWSSMPSWAPV